MLRTTLQGIRHLALLLARVAVGVTLVARGWHRWMTVGIEEQARILAEASLPSATLLAWLVTLFELVGGVLLVFGLATPVIGLGIAVLHGGIALLRPFDGILLPDGMELHLVLVGVGLLFLAFGSGKLGADALFLAPRERRAAEEPATVPPPRETERTMYAQETHSERPDNPMGTMGR